MLVSENNRGVQLSLLRQFDTHLHILKYWGCHNFVSRDVIQNEAMISTFKIQGGIEDFSHALVSHTVL